MLGRIITCTLLQHAICAKATIDYSHGYGPGTQVTWLLVVGTHVQRVSVHNELVARAARSADTVVVVLVERTQTVGQLARSVARVTEIQQQLVLSEPSRRRPEQRRVLPHTATVKQRSAKISLLIY